MRITLEQFQSFESFFQYGNLKKANTIFVGFEEGLGYKTLQEAVENRLNKIQNYPELIEYLDASKDIHGGYYITNFKENFWLENQHLYNSYEEYKEKDNVPSVMLFQAYIELLLDSKLQKIPQKQELKQYVHDVIHTPDSNTSMFEICPLPSLNIKEYEYDIESLFSNKDDYYHYCFNPSSKRLQLIKKCYDENPMTVTFIYAGRDKGKFRAESIYKEIGFEFGETLWTDNVPEKYRNQVKPSNKPKRFKVGVRERNDGHVQLAILTPFLGNGQIGYQDLLVIISHVLSHL